MPVSALRWPAMSLWLLATLAATALQATEAGVDEAFAAGEWQKVVQHLDAAAEAGDDLSRQRWFQLGFARYQLGSCLEALEALAKARPDEGVTGGPSPARVYAAEAACNGQLGRPGRALESLARAVEAGLPPGVLASQKAFDPIRDRPRFTELAERAEALAYPCREQREARQFDFWLGSWSVSVNGAVVGHNEIASRQEGCLLFEEYTAGAYGGQSFSYWDPASASWHQLWIDNRGQVTHYEGRLIDGSMVLEGLNQGRRGGATKLRMTFTPLEDGTVRQRIEQWDEETKAWGPNFDGIYTRVE